MRRLVALLTLLVAGAATTSGCASSCAATSEKLAALKRGMSYDEATGVMGCQGKAVSRQDETAVATYEWDGPKRGAVSRTQLDFADGRLLYYTSNNRGGW